MPPPRGRFVVTAGPLARSVIVQDVTTQEVLFERTAVNAFGGPDDSTTFMTALRVTRIMNRMHLALEANTPQEVFNYLWSLEDARQDQA